MCPVRSDSETAESECVTEPELHLIDPGSGNLRCALTVVAHTIIYGAGSMHHVAAHGQGHATDVTREGSLCEYCIWYICFTKCLNDTDDRRSGAPAFPGMSDDWSGVTTRWWTRDSCGRNPNAKPCFSERN